MSRGSSVFHVAAEIATKPSTGGTILNTSYARRMHFRYSHRVANEESQSRESSLKVERAISRRQVRLGSIFNPASGPLKIIVGVES